jgi:adenylate kinase family enzyme
MLVGLQGAGKTTSAGKLSKWLGKNGHRPMLVSVDVYRPAAREQLKVIAKDIGVNIWEGESADKPLDLCRNALREARNTAHDVLIIDTAGRLHIDETLMRGASRNKEAIHYEILTSLPMPCLVGRRRRHQQFPQLGFNGFISPKWMAMPGWRCPFDQTGYGQPQNLREQVRSTRARALPSGPAGVTSWA